ncbi:MAG TPA: imidazole glycerol phosphate synthase subunit HisH [Elusimicrobiota bacterium]|nr:imidazole glycerol phosphate synthase subunit HisH [Elusimicrobiota bacterium]
MIRKRKEPIVGVLDYGMGNLRSVAKSFEAVGAKVRVSSSRRVLAGSDLLVVPGVGAFDAAMSVLRRKKLDGFIRRWVAGGKPYFGICLGLQLLFEKSDESPRVRGLGILPGRVRRFSVDRALKVPHMGWNRVAWSGARPGPARPDCFYFVHSFFPQPKDRSIVWGKTSYGRPFCAAVAAGNIRATQFHPEKSGSNGLKFLKRLMAGIERGRWGS